MVDSASSEFVSRRHPLTCRPSCLQGPLARWRRPAMLAATAMAALLLGVLVYLTDRAGASAAMIPSVAILADRHLFGAIGQWLPSFIHPLAFSLLTAAVLPACTPARYGACVAWGLVNVVFEAGQHAAISAPLVAALHEVMAPTPPARWLANYFRSGTFDLGDLLAACLGALAAAAVIHLVRPQREPTHAS